MKHSFLLHYPDKIVRFKAENVGEQMEKAISLYGLPSSIECREECEIIDLDSDEIG